MTQEKNGVRKLLLTLISILGVAVLSYSAIFVSWNYAQDEKRDSANIVKHEQFEKRLTESEINLARQTATLEAVQESVQEIKQGMDNVGNEVSEVKTLLINMRKGKTN